MNMLKIAQNLTIFILITAMTACSLPGGGGDGGAPTSVRGDCVNPLYPVVVNATWNYTSSGSVIGDYEFAQRITNVRADGFTLTIEYSTGVTTTQEWSCQAGDLVVLEAGNGPAATLASIGGTSSQVDTEDVSGVTLPASITSGSAWSQTFTFNGEANLPNGTTGTGEGSYSSTYKALGMETITVAAGTFEAMRIEVESVYDLTVTVELEGQEIEVPVAVGSTITMWYASNIGLVKMVSNNDMMGEESIELTRYTSP